MAKSTSSNISIRMDSDLKSAAEALFDKLGMSLRTVFNILFAKGYVKAVSRLKSRNHGRLAKSGNCRCYVGGRKDCKGFIR